MLKRSLIAAVLSPVGLLAMMGSTDCEDFDPVVVPAHDNGDPLMGTRMLVNGDDEITLEEIDIEVHSSNAQYIIYPFVVDPGGAHRLTTAFSLDVTCRDPDGDPGLGTISDGFPQVDEQDGNVGDEVSNGLVRHLTTFETADFANDCHGDQVLESAALSWSARGEDFAGNESLQQNSIVFRPPGSCGCAHGPLGNLCLPSYDGCNPGFNAVCQAGTCGACTCQ
jgi:hypothetical protein